MLYTYWAKILYWNASVGKLPNKKVDAFTSTFLVFLSLLRDYSLSVSSIA
ncbi:hypothetical protein CGI63_16715 [Vibrio parahaemolyticus]|nr:hypothetical protein CGI63_16715 [Vibrio parahaemolyticus]